MRSKKASYIMYYIDVEHKYTEKNLHPKRSAFWQRRNIYQIMPRRKRLKGNFG